MKTVIGYLFAMFSLYLIHVCLDAVGIRFIPMPFAILMIVALVGMIVSAILSTMLLPPIPNDMKWHIRWYKKSTVFLQWLLLPVTLILFGSFPALDAQIRLMLGKYLGFWVTEKVRK